VLAAHADDLYNDPGYVVLLGAVPLAGAVAVGINPTRRASKLPRPCLRDARAGRRRRPRHRPRGQRAHLPLRPGL